MENNKNTVSIETFSVTISAVCEWYRVLYSFKLLTVCSKQSKSNNYSFSYCCSVKLKLSLHFIVLSSLLQPVETAVLSSSIVYDKYWSLSGAMLLLGVQGTCHGTCCILFLSNGSKNCLSSEKISYGLL